jgi:RecA-family ATPase
MSEATRARSRPRAEHNGSGPADERPEGMTRKEWMHPDEPISFDSREQALDWASIELLNDQTKARLIQLQADQQAKAQLAGAGWTPPRLLGQDDIEKLPDPEPLIEHILDHGTVGMLSGYTQTAKSFLALDWALCVAHGVDWNEHEAGQGNVIYVAAEDGAGLKYRTRAWRDHRGVSEGKIRYIIQAVNLAVDTQVDWLIEQVRAQDAHFVIIDTYAKCSAGAEENSATDTAKIVANLYRIANAIEPNGTTVLLVHHTGYDKKRSRGSSALISDIDYAFNMESDDPHEYTELTAAKRKDAAPPPTMGFQLKTVGPSCVLRQVDVAAKTKTSVRDAVRDQRTAEIRKMREEHPDWSMRKVATESGIPKSTVHELWPITSL